MPRIENWSIRCTNDPYIPPECRRYMLVGLVYGHSRKTDGKEIVTSYIIGGNGNIVFTKSGSRYELGEVDLAYESEFPNAKDRVLKQIERLNDKLSDPKDID